MWFCHLVRQKGPPNQKQWCPLTGWPPSSGYHWCLWPTQPAALLSLETALCWTEPGEARLKSLYSYKDPWAALRSPGEKEEGRTTDALGFHRWEHECSVRLAGCWLGLAVGILGLGQAVSSQSLGPCSMAALQRAMEMRRLYPCKTSAPES